LCGGRPVFTRRQGGAGTATLRPGAGRDYEDACATLRRSTMLCAPAPDRSIVLLEGERSTPYGEALPDRTGGQQPDPDLRRLRDSGTHRRPDRNRFWRRDAALDDGVGLFVDIARQFVQPIRRDAVRVDADRVWGRSARCRASCTCCRPTCHHPTDSGARCVWPPIPTAPHWADSTLCRSHTPAMPRMPSPHTS